MRLIWSGSARRDLLRITAFYRAIDPQLSIRMRKQIEATPRQLLDRPETVSLMEDGITRKARIRGTPLLLFFVAEGGKLTIKEVRHQREDWASKY